MVKNGDIGFEDVEMIISTIQKNYKYGSVLLSLSAKKKAKEKADMEDLQHQREMELEKTKLETAKMLIGAKTQGKIGEIDEKGKIEMMINEALGKIKAEAMSSQKEQLLHNKKEQDKNKSELQEQGKVQDAMAGT